MSGTTMTPLFYLMRPDKGKGRRTQDNAGGHGTTHDKGRRRKQDDAGQRTTQDAGRRRIKDGTEHRTTQNIRSAEHRTTQNTGRLNTGQSMILSE
jgi:hypothetical protein